MCLCPDCPQPVRNSPELNPWFLLLCVRTKVIPPGHRVKGAQRAPSGSGLIEREAQCAPLRSMRTRILGVVTKDRVQVTIHNQGSLGCYLVANQRCNQGVDKLRLKCRYMVSIDSLYTC